MVDKINARNEGLRPGTEVELFMIDLTPIGVNQQFYFQQADAKGGSVWFGGHEYVPRPIRVTGFKKSSEEAPPEPTLAIGNLDKGGYQLLNDYSDLLGAKLVRIVTYAEFLDRLADGVTPNPSADANATHIPEIWYIEQKGPSNRLQISFRLKSIMDLNGKRVPARDVLKTVCRRPYRHWNGTSFDYPLVAGACPYTGTNYFSRSGVATTAPFDECGKDPEGCQRRFPNTAMPGWFFPGVRRISRNG